MRKEMKWVCLIFVLALFHVNCTKKTEGRVLEKEVVYSFFVAGHVYGKPGVNNVGVHPPFKSKFNLIKNDSLIQFGVFTGDIVYQPSIQDWDEIDDDVNDLGIPVYFAPGNHDMLNKELFEQRYGDTYFHFIKNKDLFIVLDPNIDSWNISGNQLSFLENVVEKNAENVDNIFVFFHQVLWWDKENKYKNVHLNSVDYRSDSLNFFATIEPMFRELTNNVVMFSGDVGAFYTAQEFMHDNYENITLVASGMGGGVRDNFIITDVYSDKTIGYRLIHLNGDNINSLGNLTDYVLE
jgi:hypothetical protein